MRVFSRDLLVGFYLAVAVAASACQPVQPVAETPTAVTSGVAVNEAVTTTATLSETLELTGTDAVSQTEAISATQPASESVSPETDANPETADTGSSGAAEPVDPTLVEAGLRTYRAQYCGVCHTLDAAETRGVFGPAHNDMRAVAERYFTDGIYSGAATTPAEYIRESIVDPQAFIAPGFANTSHRMPSYAHLDSASIDALVALLLAQ